MSIFNNSGHLNLNSGLDNKIMPFEIHPGKISEIGSWFEYSIQIGNYRFDGFIEEGFSNFSELIVFLENIIDGSSAIYETFSPNSEIEISYTPITDLIGEIEIRRGWKVHLAGLIYKKQFIQEIYFSLLSLAHNKNVLKYQNTEYRYYDWEIKKSSKVEFFLSNTTNELLP